MNHATLQTLAKDLGVSTATVSRALDGRGHVRVAEGTLKRVHDAAKRLGYRTNPVARSLATGRTRMISVHVIKLETPFFARMLATMQAELVTRGYEMLVQKLPGQVARESAPLPAASWPVDGEIVLDGGPRYVDLPTHTETLTGRSVVSMGVYCMPGLDQVRVEVGDAATGVFDAFHAQGRRRIAYVVDEAISRQTAEPMLNAYRAFCRRVSQREYFIITADRTAASAAHAVRAEFERASASARPDAIFTHGDLMAMVSLGVLQDLGLHIPEDVAVVGCGGSEESAYLRPAMSTIEFPVQRMCRLAWELLERRMADPDAPIQSVVLPASFCPRTSSMSTSNPVGLL